MMRLLGMATVLACFAGTALAGPNAGGVLMITSTGIVPCSDNAPFCGDTPVSDCEGIVTRADGANSSPIVLNVLAIFDPSANNRLAGITFGITFNDAEVFLVDFGPCGDFELADANWPSSGSGTAVTWNAAQTGEFIDVYWLAAYNYYANPNTLDLIAHPSQGGNFADDSIPSNVDAIAAFGAFGFDTPGTLICPEEGDPNGACCLDEGVCVVVLEADCFGEFLGAGTLCVPNPCPDPPTGACCDETGLCSMQTEIDCQDSGGIYIGDDETCEDFSCVDPVLESSWGEIKTTFR